MYIQEHYEGIHRRDNYFYQAFGQRNRSQSVILLGEL